MPETSDGFPLFSCCHSEPTSLVSESVEDAMIPVAFDDEEEAELCPLPRGSLHSASIFHTVRGCHVSSSVQFLELSTGYSGSPQVGLLFPKYSWNNFLKPRCHIIFKASQPRGRASGSRACA